MLKSGFTTLEMLISIVLVALLATLALPAYQQQILRARRADAHAGIARIQQAQEQRRSQQPAYTGTLGAGGLGLSANSPAGHYTLATSVVADSAGFAYRVSATASGPQADDAPCRHLGVDVNAGTLQQRSGPSTDLDNDSATNRRCWNP